MALPASLNPTPVDRLWPVAPGAARLARSAALALLGSLLLWASAKVQVPFYPVPMTMQTAVVFLIGIAYGPRLGVATVLLYLAEGAMGLPVFAGTPERGIGLPYMMGPTGGYLASYPLVVALVGYVAQRRHGVLPLALSLLAGTAIIYLLGAGWLAGFVGLEKAVAVGVVPFLLGDAVKLALVATLAAAGLARLGRGPAA